uniref:Uncharacterized protein n=1 Tax=Caenorhabditis japonica TaxID=281687 RepID=A0A8R1HUN7_CAEJA
MIQIGTLYASIAFPLGVINSSISIEWLSNAFLIDIYDFQPSVVLKLTGYLANTFPPMFLYSAYIVIEEVSSTSALILFCSRLLLIANMYRPHQTLNRYTLEFLIYTLVAAFGLWPIPTTIWHIPDQVAAKSVIVHQSQEPYYPDCLFEPVAIVTTDPGSGDENVAILTIVNHISVGIAIFVSAKLAFWMLSQRMVNQSEATKKLHKKFNQRTIFQVCARILAFLRLYEFLPGFCPILAHFLPMCCPFLA